MAADPQLGAAGSRRKGRVIFLLIAVLLPGSPACAQDLPCDQIRLTAAQSAFDAGHWEEAASLAGGPADQSPELDFLAGPAFARLAKWFEAQLAFESGLRKAANDTAVFVVPASSALRQKGVAEAKRHL